MSTAAPDAVDVATRETATFLLARLGRPPRRLLEVGCGRGEVAVELQRAGHVVLAVDADPSAVAAARARGVDARLVAWPEFEEDAAFDAVIFTRSLHHLRRLDESVARAAACLAPDGILLVEDFAFREADAPTIGWCCDHLGRIADAAAVDVATQDCFAARLLRHGPAAWYDGHGEELHAAAAMKAALAAALAPPGTSAVPYLYRYVLDLVGGAPAAGRLVRRALAAERRAAAAGHIRLIGRRFVARRGDS